MRRQASHALRISGALVGVGLTAWIAAKSDRALLAESLRAALPVLPVCAVIELLKLACESFATRRALGPAGPRVPWKNLLLTHLVSNAVSTVLPMPRPAAEATKASLLLPWVKLSESTSSGATMQAATFVAVAATSVVCGFACEGPTRLALFANAGTLFFLGVGIRALIRSKKIADFIARRWPARAEAVQHFHETSKTGAIVPIAPSAALLAGIGLQLVEVTVLGWAIGVPPRLRGSLAAFGIHLLTASLAVLVPGQLGAREAAFSYSAELLGTTPTHAAAIALFWHVVQLVVAIAGFVALPFMPGRQRD